MTTKCVIPHSLVLLRKFVVSCSYHLPFKTTLFRQRSKPKMASVNLPALLGSISHMWRFGTTFYSFLLLESLSEAHVASFHLVLSLVLPPILFPYVNYNISNCLYFLKGEFRGMCISVFFKSQSSSFRRQH